MAHPDPVVIIKHDFRLSAMDWISVITGWLGQEN
jgi:hypothetical protein